MNTHPLPIPNLLEEIIEWCYESEFPYGLQIPWTHTHLQILLRYSSQVEVDSAFNLRMYRKLRFNAAWQDRWMPQVGKTTAKLVVSFLEDLGELFKVPKLLRYSSPLEAASVFNRRLARRHRSIPQVFETAAQPKLTFQYHRELFEVPNLSHTGTTLKKNELLAGFICFLLHLLLVDPSFIALYTFPDIENRIVKELRGLVTILVDTPFQDADHEQVQSILPEFEVMANEAATLVHSLAFNCTVAVAAMNEAIGALYQHIHLLKSKITEFLDFSPTIVFTPMLNARVDVGSLLCDLQDVMNLEDNPIVEVKKQIKTLHQWLKLTAEDLTKEPTLEVIAVAQDVESLISFYLVGDLPLWYLTIRLDHCINKIESNAINLQEMKQDFKISGIEVADDFSAKLSLQDKRDFMVNEVIIGFEKQEQDILDQLLRGTNKLHEIFIFGMAGIGKTTLAKRMFHHHFVNCHFEKVSWCVVSQVHERKALLIDILSCIQSELKDEIKKMDEEHLELKIYQCLKNRRYLIVMDDVWDSKARDDLQFLPDDRNGSRILITSRNKDVAPPGSTIHVHELPLLSSDQCWELLKKRVFHNNSCPPQLHDIGKKIATNCHGLPLSIVVIAGILSTKDKEESTWRGVGQKLERNMSNSVTEILELSYKHLPHFLKHAFTLEHLKKMRKSTLTS